MTTQDVAERLGIAGRTLRRLMDAGEGPPVIRVGRQLRYRPADVDAWLKSRPTGRMSRTS